MMEWAEESGLVTADNVTYWEGCERGELLLQRCGSCGRLQFPHRLLCSHCWSPDVAAVRVSGRGTVYSFAVVHRAPTRELQARAPYTIAMIDLDEGPRLMSHIVGCAPDEVAIGQRVEVVFAHQPGEPPVPRFRPAGAG